MSGETYVKLNRAFFAQEMPADMKRVFMLAINNTPCFGEREKIFLCDNIFHYEDIGDFARKEILDVLDELRLFACNK
jgi:hypothetical protein